MRNHITEIMVRPHTSSPIIMVVLWAILLLTTPVVADPPPDDIDPQLYTSGPREPGYRIGDTFGPHTIQYSLMEYFSWFWDPETFPVLEAGVNSVTIEERGSAFWVNVPLDLSITITGTGDEQLPDLSQPRGSAWFPTDTETLWWVADVGVDAVLQVNEAGDVTTIYDGPELSDPTDLVILENDAGEQVCVVASSGNSQLVLLDMNGSLIGTVTDPDFISPTAMVGHDTKADGALLTDRGSDSLFFLQLQAGPSLEVMSLHQGDPLDQPTGVAFDYLENQIFVVNENNTSILGLAFNEDGTDSWSMNPTNKTILEPVDLFVLHPRSEYDWPGRVLLIADRGKNRILRVRGMDTGRTSVFADGIPGLRSINGSPVTRDVWILTEDIDGNSLVGFPNDVNVQLDTTGDVQIAAFREDRYGHELGGMDAVGGPAENKRLHFGARRGERISVWLGSEDADGPQSIDLTVALSAMTATFRPYLEASPGTNPGEIEIYVDHPVGMFGDTVDEITVYQVFVCDAVEDLVEHLDSEECDWDEGWDLPLYIEEAEMRFCLQAVKTVTVDSDDETTFTFDDSDGAWPQDGHFCFVARGKDTDSGFLTRLSPLVIESCTEPQTGTTQGLSCANPHEALEGLSNDLIFNRFGPVGEPTWFHYEVPGPADQQHLLASFPTSNINYEAVIEVFTACASDPIASDLVVYAEAMGSTDLYFRVTEFGDLPYSTGWQLLDFILDGDTNIDPADNLTATTDEDGQITVCWDDPSGLNIWPVDESLFSYNIYSRQSGVGDFKRYPVTWWGSCFVDTEMTPGVPLEPGDQKDYYVVLNIPYSNILTGEYTQGPASSPVTGQTGPGEPADTVDTPGNFDALFPDLKLWWQLADYNNDRYAIQVSWDADAYPHGFVVENYSLNSGEVSYGEYPGGKFAGFVQPNELGLECLSVWSYRDQDGERTYSEPAGWRSCSGVDCDADHCLNLCTDATIDIDFTDYDSNGNDLAIEELGHSVDVGFFRLEAPLPGPYYAASFWGLDVEICAFEGASDCKNLESRGCSQPGADGDTVHSFTASGDGDVYIQLTRQIAVSDLGLTRQRGIDFTFGRGLVAPTPELPRVSVSIPDTECGDSVEVTYSLDNYPAEYVEHTQIVLDDTVLATINNASGTYTIESVSSGVNHFLEVRTFFAGYDGAAWQRLLILNQPGVQGDTNSDCALNILDVIKMLNYILGVSSLPAAILDELDFTGGGVEATDLVVMVARILT